MRTFLGFLLGLVAGAFLVADLSDRRERIAVPLSPRLERSGGSAVPRASGPPAPDRPAGDVQSPEAFLIVRFGGDGQRWEEALLVEQNHVRSLPLPEEVDRTVAPQTDGERVYAYVPGRRGRRLVAFTLDGREDETISDSTPLVEPRGLLASPQGLFLGFFLDDRTSLATELWMYDTSARTKRVSVERLKRSATSGPFFAPDGSFLLSSEGRVLGGSPRRTGVDILDVEPRAETVRWEAGLARSPDGQRVALVTETGDARTIVTSVVEIPLGDGSHRARFSFARGSVRILGWVEPETLLLLSGPRTPRERHAEGEPFTLWVLGGNGRTSHVLGRDLSSFAVAPDGRAMALLREAQGAVRLEVRDLSQDASRTVASLRTPEAGPAHFRLLQFLQIRAPVPPAAAAALRGAGVPREVILQAVSDRLREIAEPSPGEPVSLERVWLLPTPATAYVDYRVGTTLWRRLVRVRASPGAPSTAEVLGVFAPIGGEWVLARGEDVADPTPVALHELDPALTRWIEKPVAQGALP